MNSRFVAKIKKCTTQQQWLELIETMNSRQTNETVKEAETQLLVKAFVEDPLYKHYDHKIWRSLFALCTQTKQFKSGMILFEQLPPRSPTSLNLEVAQFLIHAQRYKEALLISRKSLKSQKLTVVEKGHLLILSGFCYHFLHQNKQLVNVTEKYRAAVSSIEQKASKTIELANLYGLECRLLFIQGKYNEAARGFEKASKLQTHLNLIKDAALSAYNSAACYDNCGIDFAVHSGAMLDTAKELALSCASNTVLGQIEILKGLHEHRRGNFECARKHFSDALSLQEASQTSSQLLQIHGMLAFTFLMSGDYIAAQRHGRIVGGLVKKHPSANYKQDMRYSVLSAKLLWQKGFFTKSRQILKKNLTFCFASKEINTLEELSCLADYIQKSAQLGENLELEKLTINPRLGPHTQTWRLYLFSLGQQAVFQGKFPQAIEHYKQAAQFSETSGDLHTLASCNLGLATAYLNLNDSKKLRKHVKLVEVFVNNAPENPLTHKLNILKAAVSYRSGNFAGCLKALKQSKDSQRIELVDKIAVACWLRTYSGQAFRLSNKKIFQLISVYSNTLFSPSIEQNEQTIVISKHYPTKLDHSPVLRDICIFLIKKGVTQPEELQKFIWKQSTDQLGWQQKIRNVLHKLRQELRHTMAPAFMMDNHEIKFNYKTISHKINIGNVESKKKLALEIMRHHSVSSKELSERLSVSAATAKRIISQLEAQNCIKKIRVGKSITYRLSL